MQRTPLTCFTQIPQLVPSGPIRIALALCHTHAPTPLPGLFARKSQTCDRALLPLNSSACHRQECGVT